MNDDFDTRVGAWLRDRAQPDPASLQAVRGSIDALPPRHPGRRRAWQFSAAAVVALVAIGVSAVLVLPQQSGTAPTRPAPPDPAAFVGDPRLAACFGTAGPVEFVFVMPHARDYQRHFPAMLLAPELDVDDPAFVVVFASGAQLLIGGGPRPSSSGGTATSPNPNERSVCILVGDAPNLYENVDIYGMRAYLGGSSEPSASPSPSPSEPTPDPSLIAVRTQEPQPAGTAPLELTGDLVGTLRGDRDLEIGCAWLVDPSGKHWEILWPQGYRVTFPAGRDPLLTGPDGGIVARAGDALALNGAPAPGGSFCMVGEPFGATRIVAVRPGS